ncbi:hypothetical protein ALC60_00678 [Trachymyrmex zeteki]|uniref:Uncharacterized protein n=1 Tax=Mycetomoellerius zeteki TaxID=64791 RepID=A0A151XJ75_9HYME|nr:hypothetical protein ALC60_00678 [Trachymyrmex zeteki]
MAITPGSARDNDPRYTSKRRVASIRGGFVFRKTLSFVLPMPMLINYSLTNAAPPRDYRGRFKGLRAIQTRSTLHPQTASPSTESCLSSQSYRGMGDERVLPETQKRDSSSTARRSRSRNVITGALNLFEVHCEIRRDAAEVLMATQDPIHLHREACLASTLSAKLEESKEEEKAMEEVQNEVDEDPPHIASKSLASELISLVLEHVDVDVTTNERER